jgi:uncharacterized protein (UPF0303 family)
VTIRERCLIIVCADEYNTTNNSIISITISQFGGALVMRVTKAMKVGAAVVHCYRCSDHMFVVGEVFDILCAIVERNLRQIWVLDASRDCF